MAETPQEERDREERQIQNDLAEFGRAHDRAAERARREREQRENS